MESESKLREVDRQVIAALQPDAERVRRVLRAGLQEITTVPRALSHFQFHAALAIAVSVVAAAGTYYWQRLAPSATPPELTITGTGSSIIVEGADGRRWLFDAQTPADVSSGSYVIVIPIKEPSNEP